MQKNKFVSFISDSDFLECVRWVCDAYPEETEETDMASLGRNALDPFKIVFDVFNGKMSIDSWIRYEKTRQADKTINNRVGEFHQMVLGKVDGWEDLGRGHTLGIDLKKKDDSIFIELKNKHNTVKGEDLKHVFDKLKTVANENKGSTVYYAYIIPKKPGSGEKVWNTSRREPDERIKVAWGAKVYEIVTGNENSLKEVWEALPRAINHLIKSNHPLSDDEKKRLIEMFTQSLGR